MRLSTFYCTNISDMKAEINDKKEVNHIKNVLRLKEGTKVRVIDGERGYIGNISSLDKKSVLIDLKEEIKDIYSLPHKIDAYIAILKPNAMSDVVKCLTEIGVNSITPVITRYSLDKINIERYQQIAIEAAKQCEAIKILKVNNPIKFNDLPFPSLYSLLERSDKFEKIDRNKKSHLSYLIGPEGGFSEKERDILLTNSKSISLGKRILRASTAAITFAFLLSY